MWIFSIPRLYTPISGEFLETITPSRERTGSHRSSLKKHLDLSSRSLQYSLLNHTHLNWVTCPQPDSGQTDRRCGGWLRPIRVHSWTRGTAEWDEYPNTNLFLGLPWGRENQSLMAQSSKYLGLQMVTPSVPTCILMYISLVTRTLLCTNIPLSIFPFPLVSEFLEGRVHALFTFRSPAPDTDTGIRQMSIKYISKHIIAWGMFPSCFMEKSIPIAAAVESRLESRSQSVSINSNPNAQDFHPTDAFYIVKHPSMWAAWIHVLASSFIIPFPGKTQGSVGALG